MSRVQKMLLSVSLVALAGFAGVNPAATASPPPMAAAATQKAQTESARINVFFEECFRALLKRSPVSESYLGIKTNAGKWEDLSDAKLDEDLAIVKSQLAALHHNFDFSKLDEQAKLSYRLFEINAERQIEGNEWRHYDYPVNQMFGWQSQIPSVLINVHSISSERDARTYIDRLNGIKPLLAQIVEGLDVRRKAGIMPPKFVYPHIEGDIANILTGRPFDKSEKDSPLLEDFRGKVGKLKLDEARKSALIGEAEQALLTSVKPGYEALMTKVKELESVATTQDGVWKFPKGDKYYAFMLKGETTTDMTADQIHQVGLAEVARIHGEMQALMKRVGFKGSLQEFFKFMRTDKRFHEPETQAGRDDYMKRAHVFLDGMKAELGHEFATLPKADIVVKAVEPFREKSTGTAFYEQPAPDGGRPGRMYLNLYDMSQMPIYQLEALIYHEGVPGHHMQIAIAQELQGIPKFRKFGGYTAYVEGWGLYSEWLGKDMGFYKEPYSDFGRLALELWRAVRLVTDTGIHARHWTREQAIAYFDQNTPNDHDHSVKEVERYIVMPGQATSYKIGMMKIMELRQLGVKELGARFDVRQFHDIVLKSGAVPLNVLEENVKAWIASRKKEA